MVCSPVYAMLCCFPLQICLYIKYTQDHLVTHGHAGSLHSLVRQLMAYATRWHGCKYLECLSTFTGIWLQPEAWTPPQR